MFNDLNIPAEVIFLVRRAVRLGRASRGDLAAFFPGSTATMTRWISQAAQIDGIQRNGVGRHAHIAPSGGPVPAWAGFDHLMEEIVNGNDPRVTGLKEDELPVFIPNWVNNTPLDPNALPFIVRAITSKSPFRIRYVGARRGSDASWRCVYPSGLERMGDQWRLIAADLGQKDFPLRTFVLSRIIGVAPADKQCKVPRTGFLRPGVHDYEVVFSPKINPELTPDQVAVLLNELRIHNGKIRLHGRSVFEFLRRFGAQKASSDAVWPPLLNTMDELES